MVVELLESLILALGNARTCEWVTLFGTMVDRCSATLGHECPVHVLHSDPISLDERYNRSWPHKGPNFVVLGEESVSYPLQGVDCMGPHVRCKAATACEENFVAEPFVPLELGQVGFQSSQGCVAIVALLLAMVEEVDVEASAVGFSASSNCAVVTHL